MQTKNTTQKYMVALAGLGLIMAAPVTSHAFTSSAVVTETAQATVTGGSAAMSVALLNVSNNAAAATIGWTASAGSGWQQANQYIQIDSTLTLAGSGIQTYTDNIHSSPAYAGVISSVTISPAGLVNVGSPASPPLPTAWQIVGGTNSPVAVDDPNNAALIGHTGYAWFYHEDKSQVPNNAGVTTFFANAASYIEMETAGQPPAIQFAQGSFGNSTTNTNRVYLEANFNNALGGNTYKTTTLTVELFTQ